MRIAARPGYRADLPAGKSCSMHEDTGSLRQQVREEMQRSYKPRERSLLIEPASPDRPVSGELVELRSAIAALTASYALVGQTPPEPPTFRGRLGARLVKLVQRLLFWYTPQIVHFQYSALKAFESALRTSEEQGNSVRQLEAKTRLEQQDLRAAIAVVMSRTQVLERRLEALRLQELARMDRDIARLRAQQTVQEGRIGLLIQARNESPELSGALPARLFRQEEQHNMDALYAALEDEFRGSRKEIKERLNDYLPKLIEAGIGSESMPILDVGCGRGEWLELLRNINCMGPGST